MQVVTISSVYVKFLLKGAVLSGYNPEEILRAQGLSPQILTNPRLRISTLAFADLSRALTSLLRDESLGLLATPMPLGSFRLMAKAGLSCENIQESLQTWRDLTNWLPVSASAHTLFDEGGGYIAFACEKLKGIEEDYILESLLSGCHRFHCWLANEFLPIERVDLTFPEPDFSAEHRFVFYGAPVHYGQKNNALYFSRRTLAQGNYRTREELGEFLRRPWAHVLTQPRQSNSVSVKLRLWMERLFREGGVLPLLEEACEHLGLAEQTLRRHLGQEGYTFLQLKEDARRDFAMHSLKQTDMSVEEIGLRLGFSDASSFIRSFKRWSGVTPLAYRKL